MDPKEIVEDERESTKLLINSIVSVKKIEGKILLLDQEPIDCFTVLQLLQLWDKIYIQTFQLFQEYHRLLTKLINTEESLSVLKLWEDYLIHINQFLDSPLPQHYHELSDQNKLCQIYHDVVSCQKNVIENNKQVDSSITEKFDYLTNIHNETLAKIMEKQEKIRNRLLAWENYRQDQSKLMDWLRDAENERNKLPLRYIPASLLVSTIESLQRMLQNFSGAEKLDNSIQTQLNDVLIKTCEESFINTLKVEQSSISNKLYNFKAGLRTWLDTILRIKENFDTCENEIDKIFIQLKEIKNRLSNEIKEEHNIIPYYQKERLLAVIEECSKVIDELAIDIVNVDTIKDLLKNNLNPIDIKDISQKCWLLSQQRWDLEYQISFAKQAINDQIQKFHLYEKRFERFMKWVQSVDQRLDRMSSQEFMDASQTLRRLETEIQSEVSIKMKEVDWLSMTGRELLSIENDESSMGQYLSQTLETTATAWKNILSNTDGRATKLRNIIQRVAELDIRMEDLNNWFQIVESKLSIPIKFTSASHDNYNNLIECHVEIQNEIEEHSEKVSHVLNQSDVLLKDCDMCQISANTQGVMMTIETTEKRWKNICVLSAERRNDIENLWDEIQHIYKTVDKSQKLIDNMAEKVKTLQSHLELCSIENIFRTYLSLKDINSDIESRLSLKILNERCRILLKKYMLPMEILGMLERVVSDEEDLKLIVKNFMKTAYLRVKSYDEFTTAYDNALTVVFKCEAMLRMVEIKDEAEINEINTPEAMAEHLDAIQKILAEEKEELDKADETGIEVMNWCNKKDANEIQKMMSEYRLIYENIKEKMASLKDLNILTKKGFFNVQIAGETGTKGTNMANLIDTLESSNFMRKDVFIADLNSSIEEIKNLLTQLTDFENFERYQTIADYISICDSRFNYIQYLSEVLLKEYNVDETEAKVSEVQSIHCRFVSLRESAEKKLNDLRQASGIGMLSCPLCSNKSWKQLENDLWLLEQWIRTAEDHLFSRRVNPPMPITVLESIMKDQKKLLFDMDGHKSLIAFMNDIGTHLAEHSGTEEKAKNLRERILNDNSRWNRICELTSGWTWKLQAALIQNSEFQNLMDELTAWIDEVEISTKQSEPISINDSVDLLLVKLDLFKELKKDLEKCNQRILYLKEVTSLISKDTEPSCQRLSRLIFKHQSLLGLTSLYLTRLSSFQLPELQQRIETDENDTDTEDDCGAVSQATLISRVIKASVPINVCLLLVLGAALFIPPLLDDNACRFNLGRILRYSHGPRPI